MRLSGGSTVTEGRVEIYHKLVSACSIPTEDLCESSAFFCGSDQWWTVCSKGWSYNEALVVCRQLGYPTAVENGLGASFEPGNGRVLMENVACTGHESHLGECSFRELEVQLCSYGAPAEVSCGK